MGCPAIFVYLGRDVSFNVRIDTTLWFSTLEYTCIHFPKGPSRPTPIFDSYRLNVYFVFQTGAVHTEYYKDSDLKIGTEINMWGRKLTLCDCDDFTKEYYRTKYGVGEYVSRVFLRRQSRCDHLWQVSYTQVR